MGSACGMVPDGIQNIRIRYPKFVLGVVFAQFGMDQDG